MENSLEHSYLSNKPPYIVVYERPGDNKIVIDSLTVTTPDERILIDSLNAEVPVGARVAIIGKNGTGKTTTAKALTGNFEFGSGKVGVPAGVKKHSMIMSQEAFIPDVTLRAVLNKTPDDQPAFPDEELTKVLQMVGHERLIQHIPGQQTNILVDDLLEIAQTAMRGNISDHELEQILSENAPKLVSEQFEVVQYMTETSKERLFDGLKVIEGIENPATITENLTKVIDHALLEPLNRRMDMIIEHEAFAKRGKIFPYAPGRENYFSLVFANHFKLQIDEYMANEDTDNKLRPIRINEEQRDNLVESVQYKMKKAFAQYADPRPVNHAYGAVKSFVGKIGRGLTQIATLGNADKVIGLLSPFNKAASTLDNVVNLSLRPINPLFKLASLPTNYMQLHPWTLPWRAASAAKSAKNGLSFFMDTQVVTGGEFKRRLSGGEKQRLVFAKTLLHQPKLLIADEPTAALDDLSADRMYKLLMDEMPEDSTIISIVHDLDKINYHDTLGKIEDLKLEFSKVDEDTVDNLRQAVIEEHRAALEAGNILTADL